MKEFEIDVTSVVKPTVTNPYDNTLTWQTGTNTSPTYGFTTVDWGINHYYYQLICPRCKETNWGEVDKVVTCSGKLPNRIRGRKIVEEYCGAKLKAVRDKVDYEVTVK